RARSSSHRVELAQPVERLDPIACLRLGQQRVVRARRRLARLVPEVEKGRLRAGPAAAQTGAAQADGHVDVLAAPTCEARIVTVDALEVRPRDAEQEAVAVGVRDELGQAVA